MIPPTELNRPIVQVDFDGTLMVEDGPFQEIPDGPPLPGTSRALNLLHNAGFTIHIYTARDTKRVWEWVRRHGYDVWISAVSNRKSRGHVALFDNAAIPIPNGLLAGVQDWLATPRKVTA